MKDKNKAKVRQRAEEFKHKLGKRWANGSIRCQLCGKTFTPMMPLESIGRCMVGDPETTEERIARALKETMLPWETAYPIYWVDFRWTEDAKEGETYGERFTKDLPPGRIHNSSGKDMMLKEEKTIEEIVADQHARWFENSERPNPRDLQVSVRLKRRETWCLEWFCHHTHDVGRTDAEYVESFERYVMRTEEANQLLGEYKNGYFHEPYCLMGAEDRWRWRGENESPPPCRCAGCVKHGIVRIGH